MIAPSELKERLIKNKLYPEGSVVVKDFDVGFNTGIDRALVLVTELQQAAELVERPFIKLSKGDKIISLYCTLELYEAVANLDSSIGPNDPMAIFKIYTQLKKAFRKKG